MMIVTWAGCNFFYFRSSRTSLVFPLYLMNDGDRKRKFLFLGCFYISPFSLHLSFSRIFTSWVMDFRNLNPYMDSICVPVFGWAQKFLTLYICTYGMHISLSLNIVSSLMHEFTYLCVTYCWVSEFFLLCTQSDVLNRTIYWISILELPIWIVIGFLCSIRNRIRTVVPDQHFEKREINEKSIITENGHT